MVRVSCVLWLRSGQQVWTVKVYNCKFDKLRRGGGVVVVAGALTVFGD